MKEPAVGLHDDDLHFSEADLSRISPPSPSEISDIPTNPTAVTKTLDGDHLVLHSALPETQTPSGDHGQFGHFVENGIFCGEWKFPPKPNDGMLAWEEWEYAFRLDRITDLWRSVAAASRAPK